MGGKSVSNKIQISVTAPNSRIQISGDNLIRIVIAGVGEMSAD